MFLGVGTGEALNEQASTGQFGRYPERAARLIEAVTLIRRLWTGEKTTFARRYYRTQSLKLWNLPARPVPIYIAASGPENAYPPGRYGDGWITGAGDFMKKSLRDAFAKGAHAAGKNPATMPKLVEQFVGGGQQDRRRAGRPAVAVHRRPVDQARVRAGPGPHPGVGRAMVDPVAGVRALAGQHRSGRPHQGSPALLAMGATPYIHSGQADQRRVLNFYGQHVLPHL